MRNGFDSPPENLSLFPLNIAEWAYTRRTRSAPADSRCPRARGWRGGAAQPRGVRHRAPDRLERASWTDAGSHRRPRLAQQRNRPRSRRHCALRSGAVRNGTLALAGLYGLGKTISNTRATDTAIREGGQAFQSPASGSTPEAIRARADELANRAKADREAASSFLQSNSGRGEANDQADRLDIESKRLKALADAREAATLAVDPKTAQIADFGAEAFASSMKAITDAASDPGRSRAPRA